MEVKLSPMKILAGIGVFSLLAVSACSVDRIPSGYVGVRVNNLGSNSGVEAKPLPVGYHFSPPGTTIYEYPVFTSNYTWQKEEAFTFQDRNGLSITAAVSIAYRADPSSAPKLFQKYRVDMDGILQGAMRNSIRNAIVTEASTLSVDQIYGPQKAALIERARQRASRDLGRYGLIIEQLYWASNVILPQNIQNQINQRVANEQAALAAQADVATREARARAEVAEATGRAEALRIEGQSITANPAIVQLRAIEKWNGQLPNVSGGNTPFINIPNGN